MYFFIPAFFYITPNTTYITSTQPHKISGLALVKALSL
jgi:hypothetical protein